MLIRGDAAQPIRSETIFQAGDKVLAVSRTECEVDLRRELIGEGEASAITSLSGRAG